MTSNELANGSKSPASRRLKVYTYDPSLSALIDTALINVTVLHVPWEDDLSAGPVGEYLEVIDYDPASQCYYSPVDLNDPHLLAQDGLAPSEGNPQFHQQMVYAVAMTTIRNFERALGRKVLWSPHFEQVDDPESDSANERGVSKEYVPRLRIYPHAMRDGNAYYSPEKKALLFGYFPAETSPDVEGLPGGMVFTCLSHDVIAHETTHALLDGMHRYFATPSNIDVPAFHEAFADLVAMFQHFTQPSALRHQIARTRGNLAERNHLGELARQFGYATGNRGALRDAIGRTDEEGKWLPQVVDPEQYNITKEPHDRGAILVAAMFDAFRVIYDARTADLLRIATGGTGRLPEGNIHPDLVDRLSSEAAKTSAHLLRMAIRALDYCPPVDITFGEYLRAMITADFDIIPNDFRGYRIAVIEAFRKRGIYPTDVRTLSVDSLLWHKLPSLCRPPKFSELIRRLKDRSAKTCDWMLGKGGNYGLDRKSMRFFDTFEWQTNGDRAEIAALNDVFKFLTRQWLMEQLIDAKTLEPKDPKVLECLGLCLAANAPATIYRGRDKLYPGLPALEVHAVRSARRPLQDGSTKLDLVIEITQRRRGYLDESLQQTLDKPKTSKSTKSRAASARALPRPDFVFRGGCTLLIDAESGTVRYCIVKNITSETRLARQRDYEAKRLSGSLRATYSPRDQMRKSDKEPFCMLHRSS